MTAIPTARPGAVPFRRTLVVLPLAAVRADPRERERQAAHAAGQLARGLHRPTVAAPYGGVFLLLQDKEDAAVLAEQAGCIVPLDGSTVIRHA